MSGVDERTIASLEKARLTHLEAQIVDILMSRSGMELPEALDSWYSSDLCASVERNDYGLQFLDANYLVDELLGRMPA